jgi:excinuclease ABC subunit B
MIRELGYCSGIENYSRYLDGRLAGTRPLPSWLFPKIIWWLSMKAMLHFLHTMYGGDRSRKI